MTMHEVALGWVGHGYHVFPCNPENKRPMVKGGFKSATKDTGQVNTWWKQWPNSMPGLPTGEVSGFFVLDIDERENVSGNRTLADMEQSYGKLPETYEILTPSGGRHLYFRNDGSLKNSAGKVGAGLDIRAKGGYVIAPGSITSDGRVYQWAQNAVTTYAEAPDWLIGLAKAPTSTQTLPGTSTDAYATKAAEMAVNALISCEDGCRNDTLNTQAFGLFGLVKAGRLSEEVVRNALGSVAEGKGLSPQEVKKTLDSAFKAAKPRFADSHKERFSLADFRAFMPDHRYIFIPTRDHWPASSVDSRIDWILDSAGNKIKPSRWLDKNVPVEQMTWAPGMPMLIENKIIDAGGWIERDGCTCFNLYREPTLNHGDASKADQWVEHVHRVYPNDADHIIQWLAQRVQKPDENINHALVLGGKPGIGKDTLLEPVKQAVGPWNCQEVAPGATLGRFNGFVKSVILRVSEARDLGDINRFAFYDHMKTIIAAPPDVIRVDEKYLREYSVPNVCGVIITTNYKTNGLYLPEDDRRHYVAWSDLNENPFAESYWKELWGWYYNGGFEHVAAYLAQLDISEFDANAPPRKTDTFWHMVNANRAPEDVELADVLDRLDQPDALTLDAIKASANSAGYPDFAMWLGERKNRRNIPHRMEAAGYEPVRNPTPKDGYWKINGKRQAAYAKTELSIHDRIVAVEKLM